MHTRTGRERSSMRSSNMNKTLCMSILIMVLLADFSLAQEPEPERDPFFADGPRASAADATQGKPQQERAWGRDPFSRPFEGTANRRTAPVARARDKKLTGIIYGTDVHLAIIGGEVLREGSMLGDQKLTAVHEGSIVLTDNRGNTEEVVLENFSVRK